MNVSILICFGLVLMIVGGTQAQSSYKSGHCPLKDSVTRCTPKCYNDFECSSGKCCANKCGSKSCTSVSPVSTGNDGGYKSHSSDVYCAGVKCGPYEKCEFDRSTKQNKCVRT